MKLLRKTIRRLIIETSEHICDDFVAELEKRYEKRPQLGDDGLPTSSYALAKVFPDGCEVHFTIDALEYDNAYINGIETVGDDCVRKGYARDTLQSIFDLADEMGIWILGEADPFDGKDGSTGDRPDLQELLSFYRSMGVKIVDGTDLERRPRKS